MYEDKYLAETCFFNNGPILASFFVYFRPFPTTISIKQIEKSLDGVLGIRTHGCIPMLFVLI